MDILCVVDNNLATCAMHERTAELVENACILACGQFIYLRVFFFFFQFFLEETRIRTLTFLFIFK
jgi:hypothetical protein